MKSIRKLKKAIEKGNWLKVDSIIREFKSEAARRHPYAAPLASVEALKIQLEIRDLKAARNNLQLLAFQLGL